MPTISIIIAVYNVEKYLSKCLDSILKQTFTDFECICVNDGSTDNSLYILEKYKKKDKRIKIISQENKGQASARNAALKIAGNKYVTFIDSDDWATSNWLELLYNEIEKEKADISCCNIIKYYQKENNFISNILPKEQYFNITDLDSVKIKKAYGSPYPGIKIYKTNFLKSNNISFYDGYFTEDNPFTSLCFIYAKKVTYIKNELYFYRLQRENSTTSNKNKISLHKIFVLIKLMQDIIDRNKFNNSIFDYIFKTLLWDLSIFDKNIFDFKTKTEIFNTISVSLENCENYKNKLNTKNKLKLKLLLFILNKFQIKSFKIIRILKNFFK